MAKTATNQGMIPAAGKTAPAFSAPGSNGKTIKLSDFKGKKTVVLYFYPRDNTPGCTTEACGFRDMYPRYTQADIEVLGVSPDSLKSHANFAKKFDLPFTLLSDEDQKICQAYGVWQQKTMAGRKYMGVVRTTFVIDQDGKIAHVFDKVKPAEHNAEVFDWIKANL